MCEKENSLPYYKKYIENPDLPRPLEPCNDFEHPIRWANLAYWEKARADRMEKQRDALLEVLDKLSMDYQGGGVEQISRDAIAKIRSM